MTCKCCGKPLKRGAKVCPCCGIAVGDAPSAYGAAYWGGGSATACPTAPSAKRRGGAGKLIAIIAVAVVVLAAGVVAAVKLLPGAGETECLLASEVDTNVAGEETSACYYTYDDDGRMLTETCYRYGSLYQTNTYSYDSQGRLASEAYEYIIGSYNQYTYTYAGTSNQIQSCVLNKSGENCYGECSYSGNQLTMQFSDENGEPVVTVVRTYDSAREQVLEEIEYDEDGALTLQITYDSYGNPISAVAPGFYSLTYAYTYDEHGNWITRMSYYTSLIEDVELAGNLYEAETRAYTYDKNGNATEATVYDEDGAITGYVTFTYAEQ